MVSQQTFRNPAVGKPMKSGRNPIPFGERLRNCYYIDDDGCWITKSADKKGWPRMRIKPGNSPGTQIATHHAMYQLYHGPIPERHTIERTCRKRACVRPDHLYACPQKQRPSDKHHSVIVRPTPPPEPPKYVPSPRPRRHIPTSVRIHNRIIKQDNGCWIFQTKQKWPYIHVTGAGKISVHRFIYETHFGPIPDGYKVSRTCNHNLCVAPAHLFANKHSPKDIAYFNRKKGAGAT